MGISVWSKGDKIVVILGEDHSVPGLQECMKRQHVEFLPWFEKEFQVSDDAKWSPWDVMIELRRDMYGAATGSFQGRFSPIMVLMNYIKSHKCTKHLEGKSSVCPGNLRFHYINLRPNLHALVLLPPRPDWSPAQWMQKFALVDAYLAQVKLTQNETLRLIKKQLRYSSDKEKERFFNVLQWSLTKAESLDNVKVDLKHLREMLAAGADPSVLFAQWVHFIQKRILTLVDQQDLYTVARIMKPYMKKVLVVVGDSHRRRLNRMLEDLGFSHQYTDENPVASCIQVPTISQW
jgi:hypothetical protein